MDNSRSINPLINQYCKTNIPRIHKFDCMHVKVSVTEGTSCRSQSWYCVQPDQVNVAGVG